MPAGYQAVTSARMDGWMTRFYVFSTVFQSYQDDGRVIMKGSAQVCNGIPFTVEKISSRTELELGTDSSVGQRLIY